MRRALTFAALLMPLAGCYVPPAPDAYGYGQPAYQGQVYADQQDVYPGYDDNGGSPTSYYEGAAVPLVFFGGSWGFYDGYRRFHRAPDSVGRHLESRHPQGAGFSPYGGRTAAPTYNGGYQGVPRPQYQQQSQPQYQPQSPPQYRQNTSAPAYVAPPPRSAPAYAAPPPRAAPATAPPPVHTAAPAGPPRQEDHRDHRCPNGQTHC